MAKSNPFEDLFDQFRTLLNYVEENMNVPVSDMKVPKDIDAKLKDLQKRVDEFNKVSQDIVALSGLSNEEMAMRLKGVSEEIPPQAKELLSKGDIIKRDAEKMKDRIEEKLKHAAISVEPEKAYRDQPERPARNLSEKEKSKKRRSKFKRFGSDDKWKPL